MCIHFNQVVFVPKSMRAVTRATPSRPKYTCTEYVDGVYTLRIEREANRGERTRKKTAYAVLRSGKTKIYPMYINIL